MFTPRENNRLLDYYKIISISRPILARVNMGLDFFSGQYGCLFSRCWKYVINSLIHEHFHIGLVINPRPILAFDSVSSQYGGLGMITRSIWKCPCTNLCIVYTNVLYMLKSMDSTTKVPIVAVPDLRGNFQIDMKNIIRHGKLLILMLPISFCGYCFIRFSY